ncbi:MAG TPA: hypothetical protein VK629_07685, partial [Steroidobacteraceae bacterium]|nr:hypothetical protein [Steroidobacteraceae bacterium]
MAMLLVASGVSLFTRAARTGALMLIVLYLISALLWVPRIVSAPQAFGMWAGFAELFSLTTAAIALYASLTPNSTQLLRFACRAFGVCAIAFAGAHFSAVNETAAMVPAYFPFGQKFWAIATGLGHLLAGIAIVIGIRAQLAARLLTAMFLVFVALVWVPMLMNGPVPHMTWAGNAITLALIGAAWVISDWVGDSPRSRSQ